MQSNEVLLNGNGNEEKNERMHFFPPHSLPLRFDKSIVGDQMVARARHHRSKYIGSKMCILIGMYATGEKCFVYIHDCYFKKVVVRSVSSLFSCECLSVRDWNNDDAHRFAHARNENTLNLKLLRWAEKRKIECKSKKKYFGMHLLLISMEKIVLYTHTSTYAHT